MKNRKNPLVLVDFDGTITQNDVGALFFDTFAKEESTKIVSLWVKGRISSRECLKRLCQVTRAGKSELVKFALSQKIDGKFPDFVDYCKCKKLKLVILSDGLDFYIKLVLEKFALEELPFYSNVLRFENNRLKPEFPYFDQGCGNCGNCKRYHLQNLKKANQQVIYIGDGLSDRCAVREADLVLAKVDLHRFCMEEGIKHYSFKDFGDVIRIFRDFIIDPSKDA
jgi:2-hydroxy-3-keto-5-methylthiopentenyl-1-phosphate phosphatase